MKVKLLGFRKLSFESKEGEKIKGTQIYIAYNDSEVTGIMADKRFIKNDDAITIDLAQFLGKDIELECGLRGKIQCISA